MDAYILIQAAMFAALGKITKLSRSGHSIVFIHPVLGSNALLENEDRAICQAREAGLDLNTVTPEIIDAWKSWYSGIYETRRSGPDARFLITRKFRLVKSHTFVPANRVSLIDGWGNEIAGRDFECMDSRAEHVNPFTSNATEVALVNYKAVHNWIKMMRKKHPEFAEARIQDNNERI